MNYKYYVISCSNGAIQLNKGQVTEWSDLNAAIVAYHQKCATYWNTPEVIEGYVEIVYSADMNVVGGYKEHISHPQEEAAE